MGTISATNSFIPPTSVGAIVPETADSVATNPATVTVPEAATFAGRAAIAAEEQALAEPFVSPLVGEEAFAELDFEGNLFLANFLATSVNVNDFRFQGNTFLQNQLDELLELNDLTDIADRAALDQLLQNDELPGLRALALEQELIADELVGQVENTAVLNDQIVQDQLEDPLGQTQPIDQLDPVRFAIDNSIFLVGNITAAAQGTNVFESGVRPSELNAFA